MVGVGKVEQQPVRASYQPSHLSCERGVEPGKAGELEVKKKQAGVGASC